MAKTKCKLNCPLTGYMGWHGGCTASDSGACCSPFSTQGYLMVQDGCLNTSFHSNLLASKKKEEGAGEVPLLLRTLLGSYKATTCLHLFRLLCRKYHKLGGLQTAEICLETGKSKIKVPAHSVSVESPLYSSAIELQKLCH